MVPVRKPKFSCFLILRMPKNIAKFAKIATFERNLLYGTQSEPTRLRKRPIYVVAHMVNGDSQVNADWVKPANASDLVFNSDGSPHRFYHGPIPCDCLH